MCILEMYLQGMYFQGMYLQGMYTNYVLVCWAIYTVPCKEVNLSLHTITLRPTESVTCDWISNLWLNQLPVIESVTCD